jgi:ParB family transcriptional regulator, chromosome partitioning protein
MPASKSRLGRGLEALIPLGEDAGLARPGLLEVELAAVTPNPRQPRSPIREADLQELAASIREHGILQPLVVTPAADGYQLIAGERRWRAARLAGLATVPVLVKSVAPRAMLELALVENIQRSDLNPLEEAAAYQQLIDEFGLTQEATAQRVGKSRVAVANTLRLLKAARAVQEAVLARTISEGHARALLGLERTEAQEAALKTVLKHELTVRQTEELVRRLLGQASARRQAAPAAPEVRALQRQLEAALGTRVSLVRRGQRGRLVIHFYSDEELDALAERILGSA